MGEIAGQVRFHETTLDAIVFASSSGGTHAGLIAGGLAFGYTGKIIGVSVEKEDAQGGLPERILSLASDTVRLSGIPGLEPEGTRVILDRRYAGEGYGVVGDRERDAIRLLARLEGILLDPVYTAKAMGALIDMIARREFSKDGRVLFLHTGGAPALFANARDLV
jgi:D-cysteine desulfhydrase